MIAVDERLRGLSRVDAESASARIVALLRELADADFAYAFSLHEGHANFVVSDPIVSGDPEVVAWARAHGSTPAASHPWRPRAVSPGQPNRFVEVASRRADDDWEGPWSWRDFYAPLDIAECHRIVVYDDRRFVQYVAVGTRGARRLSAAVVRRLSHHAGDVAGAARALDAKRLQRTMDDRLADPCYAAFLACGRCDSATARARERLERDPRLLERLGRHVVGLDRRGGRRGWSVGGEDACEIVRMDGSVGARYLVTWHPVRRPMLARGAQLSQRQREIAELAASGATHAEIARHLELSPNTVKHHLKRIYELLDVGNRVELADALSDR